MSWRVEDQVNDRTYRIHDHHDALMLADSFFQRYHHFTVPIEEP